jgi:hypothetical protein
MTATPEESRMTGDRRDPRSEAEKARAALMRNDAMGLGVPESPIEQQPSVTPETFGDTTETAEARSGVDQGIEAGGAIPAGGDSTASESLAEAEQVSTSRNHTAPPREPEGDEERGRKHTVPRRHGNGERGSDRTVPRRKADGDEDVLSRAKE